MKQFKLLFLILSLTGSFPAWSGLYWVGSSPACNGANVFSTLNQALLVAALNGDPSDEIRLTNTVSYTGNSNGTYQLQDWSSSGAGVLAVVGGYPDCFAAATGRTLVGNSNSSSFIVNTNNESSSIVTLKNLTLTGNVNHGLEVDGGGAVFLDNVDISGNDFSGINVYGGGFVDVLANSIIRLHNNINNPWGGGIRCTGTGSSAIVRNKMEKNRAQQGGNIYVSSGCYVELKDGVRIEGGANSGGGGTFEGGGLYVDNGGEVFADGRANRVIFDGNLANNGGAIYINGTGFVLLQNTHINGSSASESGAAIYAKDGGTASPQLIMDQTTDCNLLFRCSEIQGARHNGSVVEVNDSFIQLQQTVIEQSVFRPNPPIQADGLIKATNGRVRFNRVGILRNQGYAMLANFGNTDFEVSHLTVASNQRLNGADSFVYFSLSGELDIQNSLITNSSGADIRGVGPTPAIIGKCNLIDDDTDWPSGTYHLGTPQLINPAAGDARQLAPSPGVDMCLQDSFAWSTEIDIENQAAPVNENTNQQGMPGQAGGLYDAGFDEVYDNIGDDEFLLTIEKEGSGQGVVISNPAGISCGFDCSQVYFNGTIVTFFASPVAGNDFMGWLNCPLVNQDDECLVSVQSSQTIRAVFEPDDLIFRDGFE